MGSRELMDKIRADGRSQVAAIAADRDRRLAEIARQRDDQVARIEQEQCRRAEGATATIRERSMSKARMERRKVLLAARWEVVERVLEAAKQRVVEGEEYRRLLKRIVGRHGSGAGVVVRVSAQDRERWRGELGVSLGEPAPISGGLLIQAGGRVLDFSLDEGLAAVRGELADELSRLLFPEAGATVR